MSLFSDFRQLLQGEKSFENTKKKTSPFINIFQSFFRLLINIIYSNRSRAGSVVKQEVKFVVLSLWTKTGNDVLFNLYR